MKVAVHCPEVPTDANLEIVLRPDAEYAEGGVRLQLAFDGSAFEVVACESTGEGPLRHRNFYWEKWTTRDVDELTGEMRDPAKVAELVSFALKPFRYAELGIDNKNAEKFYPGRCTLALAAVDGCHFLIAHTR